MGLLKALSLWHNYNTMYVINGRTSEPECPSIRGHLVLNYLCVQSILWTRDIKFLLTRHVPLWSCLMLHCVQPSNDSWNGWQYIPSCIECINSSCKCTIITLSHAFKWWIPCDVFIMLLFRHTHVGHHQCKKNMINRLLF